MIKMTRSYTLKNKNCGLPIFYLSEFVVLEIKFMMHSSKRKQQSNEM